MKRFRILGAVVVAACAAALVISLSGCSGSSDYTPTLKEPSVEPPAVAEAGSLRVGVNTDKSPLAGLGNDKIIGIDVDIAAAMADEMGLELTIVDVGSSPETAITSDKVDLVLGIDNSDGNNGFWLSEEYLPTGVALFALEADNAGAPSQDSTPKIAAQVSSKSAWAVTNAFGNESLTSSADLASAFGDLESGKVQYVAADAIIGMYAANRQGIEVEIVALLESPNGYCAGVSNENSQLQTAVNDTLSLLKSNGIIDVIEKKWLGNTLNLSGVEVVTPKSRTTTNAGDQESGGDEGDNTDAATGDASSTSTASNTAS